MTEDGRQTTEDGFNLRFTIDDGSTSLTTGL
jgi:hypothetical protein